MRRCAVNYLRVGTCTLNRGLLGAVVAYARTVKTWRGSGKIEHPGSAHDDGEVEVLKAAA